MKIFTLPFLAFAAPLILISTILLIGMHYAGMAFTTYHEKNQVSILNNIDN